MPNMSKSPNKPLPCRLRAELFIQLAPMEIAGLPVDKAFALLEVTAPAVTRLNEMRKLIAWRIDPATAGERSGLFTRIEACLIRAAMRAGSPAGMCRRLADVYTLRAMQLATMRSRLMIPASVLLLALFIQPLPSLIAGSIGVGGYLLLVVWPILVLAGVFYGARWWWQ